MPDPHFTLDVDPDGLRSVATRIGELREHLRQKGTAARGVPGEIGERWTGSAATDIKAEMTGVGNLMHDLQLRLQPVAADLRKLAGHYEDALARIPGLNQKWEAAQTDYETAVGRADTAAEAAGEDPKADPRDTQRARSHAVETAGEDRQKAQHNLEIDFGYLKMFLQQETSKLSATLVESEPIGVTDDQIEAWRSGQAPVLDRTSLVGGLALMDQRLQLLADQALEAERAEKRGEAEDDVADLEEALEDGDYEAVNAALEAIGDRSDDDIYAEQLVELLGPGGVQDLYLRIDEGLKDSDLVMEELWPSLEGFNDTVANGISQKPDDSFAEFVEIWMQQDYGAKMWALVAASDQADGRVNAIALAHHSEVYNASLANGGAGMPGLYPQAFIHAYGDEDMIEQWDDRSTGDDLAAVIQASSPEQIQKIMERMLQVNVDGGTMNEDDFAHIADTYRETVWALQSRYDTAIANGDEISLAPLVELLKMGNFNAGRDPYHSMLGLDDLLTEVVSDPAVMNQMLKDINSGDLTPSDVKDLIEQSDVEMENVVAASIQYELDQGHSAESAAEILGTLLRAEDIIGEDFNWGVVVKSLTKSGISALTARNPVVDAVAGPVIDLLESVIGEMERLEELDRAWDSSADKTGAQEIIAFNLYLQFHGEPDGFAEYAEAQEGNVSPDQLIRRYIDEMRAGEEGTPEQWEEMRLLLTTIDETRDES